jgi:hypothetical protein
VKPGTFEWTWGTGANQNFTLLIGEVPEPSTWAMMLLGFAGLGLAGWRHRRTTCDVQSMVPTKGDQAAFGMAS